MLRLFLADLGVSEVGLEDHFFGHDVIMSLLHQVPNLFFTVSETLALLTSASVVWSTSSSDLSLQLLLAVSVEVSGMVASAISFVLLNRLIVFIAGPMSN